MEIVAEQKTHLTRKTAHLMNRFGFPAMKVVHPHTRSSELESDSISVNFRLKMRRSHFEPSLRNALNLIKKAFLFPTFVIERESFAIIQLPSSVRQYRKCAM